MKEYTDKMCTIESLKEGTENVQSEVQTNVCTQIENEGSYMNIKTSQYTSTMTEFFQIEYNIGSYELFEFGKCYCYVGDLCYKYQKHATDSTKVLESEYPFESNCVVDSEPTAVELTLNEGSGEKDMKYSIVNKIPEHVFYYSESLKTDCFSLRQFNT